MTAHEKIKAILDEWDPVDILSISPDEYLPLADELTDTVNADFTVRSVFYAVKRAFKIYGVDFTRSDAECKVIAEKILNAIRN